MKKLISLLLALVLVCGVLGGCSGTSTKEYTCQELTMTVPSYMSDESDEASFSEMTFALDSFKIAIFGLKEEKSMFKDTIVESLADYAEVVVSGNGLDSEIVDREGYKYFVYTASSEGTEYTYMAGVYESDDAYWMVQIASATDDYDEEEFLEILDSVVFG